MRKLLHNNLYLNPKMLGLLALGFSSGLPRLLVYSTLTFWLMDVGLAIKSIGLFAATATPYNLKFLWAPLLDRLPIPYLTRRMGVRRSWMLVTQIGVILSLLLLAVSSPDVDPLWTALCAVFVATFSASQDVVIDAFRVEILEDEQQGAGAAVAVFGYRIAMLVASAGALYIATFAGSWTTTYLAMSVCMSVGVAATFLMNRPDVEPSAEADGLAALLAHLKEGVVGPFREFTQRDGWLALLVFVVLFKLGDALAGTMTNPFLIDIGFNKLEIANIAKTYGLVASIGGVFLGGWVVNRMGIVAALWLAGVIQLLSNFMFSLQAYVGHSSAMLVATIGIENLTGGIGTAAFVAFLSALCNKRYTATQYALLTALSSVLRTFMATGSGFAAEEMGWAWYFFATAIAAIPGVAMIAYVQKYFGGHSESARATQ